MQSPGFFWTALEICKDSVNSLNFPKSSLRTGIIMYFDLRSLWMVSFFKTFFPRGAIRGFITKELATLKQNSNIMWIENVFSPTYQQCLWHYFQVSHISPPPEPCHFLNMIRSWHQRPSCQPPILLQFLGWRWPTEVACWFLQHLNQDTRTSSDLWSCQWPCAESGLEIE